MLGKSVVLLDLREVDMVLRMRYRNTRRCLFGPVDMKEAEELATEAHLDSWEEFTKRWNFDPEKEKVLPGRYDWYGVEAPVKDDSCGPIKSRRSRESRESTLPYTHTDLMRIRKPAGLLSRPSASPGSSSEEEEEEEERSNPRQSS